MARDFLKFPTNLHAKIEKKIIARVFENRG
jgi:hypothetical protein